MIGVERHRSIGPLAAEWDALADRLRAPPFARPGWIAAWATAFSGGRVEVLTGRRDGRLVAVLPLLRRAGTLRAAANAHTPSYDVLAADADALQSLLASVYAGGPRAVALTYLAAGGASHAAARTAARTAGYRIAERTMLRAPFVAVDGGLDDHLRPRRRLVADLRRRRRRLEEHGRVTVTRDGTLDELVALEALGWKGARGTAIAARPPVRRFYTDVAAWAAPRDILRVFVLRLDGQPLSALLTVEEHGVLHLLKAGFDPGFARFSPGRLVLFEAVAYAFGAGLRRVDLGGGTESYKMDWTQTVQDRVAVQCFAPGPLGDLCWVATTQARPLAQRTGLDRLLRPGRDRLVTLHDRTRAVHGRQGRD